MSGGGIKLRVSASGFRIEQGQYDRFIFDSSTNALFFDQTQVAFLQPGLSFPRQDIRHCLEQRQYGLREVF